MQIIVTQQFSFAHHGYQVEHFAPSDEPRETTDECAELAIAEGWAKAVTAAPENRDATAQRATKAKRKDGAA